MNPPLDGATASQNQTHQCEQAEFTTKTKEMSFFLFDAHKTRAEQHTWWREELFHLGQVQMISINVDGFSLKPGAYCRTPPLVEVCTLTSPPLCSVFTYPESQVQNVSILLNPAEFHLLSYHRRAVIYLKCIAGLTLHVRI